MIANDPAGAIERLRPEVAGFQSHGFSLGSDLMNLARVLSVAAPEASVLYCGRMLEALSGEAVQQVGGEAKATAFANLAYLEGLGLLPQSARYWAHGLRKLGNEVRHVHRLIGFGEAELAGLLVERWLAWYFGSFVRGPRLPSLYREGVAETPLFPPQDPILPQLMRSVEATEGPRRIAIEGLRAEERQALLGSPSAACLLVEGLIALQAYDRAHAILDETLAGLEDTARLMQLQALLCSRRGDHDRAIELLQPLFSAGTEDEETVGILGGAYKRRWAATRERQWLERAFRIYRDGWRKSRKSLPYLGINAATLALWLGDGAASAELATAVTEILEERKRQLAVLGLSPLETSYWDAVTLAEARLLMGDRTAARQDYLAAFARHADRPGDIESTQKQAREIIVAQGEDPENYRDLLG